MRQRGLVYMEIQRELRGVGTEMPEVRISVPAKTFVCGEYVAIEGGPCLVAATQPRYTLSLIHKDKASTSPFFESGSELFHPSSPAGQFLKAHETEFKELLFKFEGDQGLGSSSAQFLTLYSYVTWKTGIQALARTEFDMRDLLKLYRQYAPESSGADVVSQLHGGLVWFQRQTGHCERLEWDFKDLGIIFVKSSIKIPTHVHLQQTHLPDVNELAVHVDSAKLAVRECHRSLFVDSIRSFREGLKDRGLTHPLTLQWQLEIEKWPGVILMKGCGALGADVYMILVEPDSLMQVKRQIEVSNVGRVFATHGDFSKGLHIE